MMKFSLNLTRLLALLSFAIFFYWCLLLGLKEFFLLPRDSESLGLHAESARLYRQGSHPALVLKDCAAWCLEGQVWGLEKNKNPIFVNVRPRVMDQAEFLSWTQNSKSMAALLPDFFREFVQANGEASIEAWVRLLKTKNPLSLDIIDRVFAKAIDGAWYGELAVSWPREQFFKQEPAKEWTYAREKKDAHAIEFILKSLRFAQIKEAQGLLFVSQADRHAVAYQALDSFCGRSIAGGIWILLQKNNCQTWTAESVSTLKPVEDAAWQNLQAMLPNTWGEKVLQNFVYASPSLFWGDLLSTLELRAIMIYDDGLVQRTLHYEFKKTN